MSMDVFLESWLITFNRYLLSELKKSVDLFDIIIVFPSKRGVFTVNNINTPIWPIIVRSQQ